MHWDTAAEIGNFMRTPFIFSKILSLIYKVFINILEYGYKTIEGSQQQGALVHFSLFREKRGKHNFFNSQNM